MKKSAANEMEYSDNDEDESPDTNFIGKTKIITRKWFSRWHSQSCSLNIWFRSGRNRPVLRKNFLWQFCFRRGNTPKNTSPTFSLCDDNSFEGSVATSHDRHETVAQVLALENLERSSVIKAYHPRNLRLRKYPETAYSEEECCHYRCEEDNVSEARWDRLRWLFCPHLGRTSEHNIVSDA